MSIKEQDRLNTTLAPMGPEHTHSLIATSYMTVDFGSHKHTNAIT
jgi:hypothetical protein